MNTLIGKRILICGKGGSGKSSIISLISLFLESRGYNVILLDGDASNPGGLKQLITGDNEGPRPLIDYFGGREKVTCPVDDPSPLLHVENEKPVIEVHVNPDDIPSDYYVRQNKIWLFQVGKIHEPYEGCDGPMSKITRDFLIDDPYVSLIDVEAGIEHFGRGIEKNVDVVLIVVDPTFESIQIASRVKEISNSMGIENVMAILNGVRDHEMEDMMKDKISEKGVDHLATINYDKGIFQAGLEGAPLGSNNVSHETSGQIINLINRLEALF